jgi:hypothetical protein
MPDTKRVPPVREMKRGYRADCRGRRNLSTLLQRFGEAEGRNGHGAQESSIKYTRSDARGVEEYEASTDHVKKTEHRQIMYS